MNSLTTTTPTLEIVTKAYKAMLLTRIIDEKMITLQRQGIITFALSSLGEECCVVASAAALQMDDWLYPQYRESGIMFWRGFSIEEYMHQMFVDALDLNHGRQMPNHFGSRKLNVVTCSSPIGTKIPHAAGCAYAMKLQKTNTITLVYFGEGATSEGDFHAGLNFAAVRKCPVIFFCRNNGYAISTDTSHQFASEGVAPKGIGYGVSTYRIDGNDFFAVYETVKKARDACLNGKGPILIEALTYRLGAHSTADDPSLYRSVEEVKQWQKKDPLTRLRHYLESQNAWNQEKEDEEIEWITKRMNAAIEKAKATPKPAIETLIEDVYEQTPESLKRQLKDL